MQIILLSYHEIIDYSRIYRKYKTREAFVHALRDIYVQELLPLIPIGLCGAIYTQASDVEDETNRLLSFDRRVQKLQPEEFLDVSQQLCEAIRKATPL